MQKGWSLLFGGVLLAAFLLTAISPLVGWWLPELGNRESFGSDADLLFYLILGFTGFFFVLTEAILVYAMYRYAAQPGKKGTYVHTNHKLEMAWTIVPAAILLFITFAQISTWADIKYASKMKPPQQIIEVSARQFEWRVRYPNEESRKELTVPDEDTEWTSKKKADEWGHSSLGYISDLRVVNEIHTWAGANTRIYLKSKDVLHSFFLPNMRLKQDAVPGKVIPVWFKPDKDAYNVESWDYKNNTPNYAKDKHGKEKVWELACAELCGWGHYKMQGRLYVHKDKSSYDKWLAHSLKQKNTTTADD